MTQNKQSDASVPLLTEYLLAENPAYIALIGSRDLTLQWPVATESGPSMMVVESLEQADSALRECDGGGDAAFESCVALLELNAPSDDIELLLGRAVRLFSTQLIVYTRSTTLPDSVLFAFGFRKLEVEGLSSGEDSLRWFEYRLSHYKQPPDWLNARFWANPERFDTSDDDDIYDDSDEEE